MTARSKAHAATTAAETPAPQRISLVPPPPDAQVRAETTLATTTAVTPMTRHMPEATALSPAEVVPCTADVHLAARNFVVSCDALAAHRDELDRAKVVVDWDAFDAGRDLGEALVLASAQPTAAKTLAVNLRALTPWSRLLASDLHTLHVRDKLSAEDLAHLVSRRRDPVERCTAVLAMVQTYRDRRDDFAGVTAVTAAELAEAEGVANKLIPRLRRGDSADAKARDAHRAMRDRFWTLVVRQHQAIARAGGALWGFAVKDHIPTLRAGQSRRARAAKPVAPPPAPANDPVKNG